MNAGVVGAVRGVLTWLPRGRSLPCESWQRRHRGLLLLLWAHVPALLAFGAVMGYTDGHGLLHVAPLVLLALLGRWQGLPQRAQAVSVSLGLVTAAAMGVHLSGGVTESHFLFFVLLIGLALYEDWLIFLLAIAYVVVHHGLAPSVGLGEVYSHGDDNSWPWALLHGAFVLFAAALCVVSWRASEQARRELQLAELESELREAQKLESLGLLAGGIAHDFNNLLVGVLGNAALVRDELPTGSPLDEYVAQIELAGQRATRLTRQMLAYSGNTHLESAPIDLSQLVEEIATLTAPGISKQARLQLELDRETSVIVHGDAGQLSQVVLNLLTNAAESLPDGRGTVTVRTGILEAGGSAFVEVADTGCGMTPETISRMFEPFYTTKFTGRGLGLAAVSGIVRSHGGTISVESRVGEGTTFTVVMPLSEAVVQAVVAPAVQPRRAAETGCLLLVDDEPTVLDVARRILERDGFDVLTASSGSEAVQRLHESVGVLRAAIVDMSMPGLNGIETMRALRRAQPSLPVILSSGYTTETLPAEVSDTRFIQKPYSAGELTALVRDVLDEVVAAA